MPSNVVLTSSRIFSSNMQLSITHFIEVSRIHIHIYTGTGWSEVVGCGKGVRVAEEECSGQTSGTK